MIGVSITRAYKNPINMSKTVVIDASFLHNASFCILVFFKSYTVRENILIFHFVRKDGVNWCCLKTKLQI